jgi:hypothetical protein
MEGLFAGVSSSLSYRRRDDSWPIESSASGFVGYFPENKEGPWYPSGSASAATSRVFSLGSRARVNLSLYEVFSTDQQLFGAVGVNPSDIPIAGDTAGFDTSLRRAPALTSSPGVSVSRDLGGRSRVEGFYRSNRLGFCSADKSTATSAFAPVTPTAVVSF